MHNANLISAYSEQFETLAGLFEKAPADVDATATTLGLWLNLVNVFLYMVNYNLVIPTMDDYCKRFGVSSSVGGAIIGAAGMCLVTLDTADVLPDSLGIRVTTAQM